MKFTVYGNEILLQVLRRIRGAAGATSKLWKFQREMGFLQPYMANGKREANLVNESDENSNTQNQEELECEDDNKDNGVVELGSEEREDKGGTLGNTLKTQTPDTQSSWFFQGKRHKHHERKFKKPTTVLKFGQYCSSLLKTGEKERPIQKGFVTVRKSGLATKKYFVVMSKACMIFDIIINHYQFLFLIRKLFICIKIKKNPRA